MTLNITLPLSNIAFGSILTWKRYVQMSNNCIGFGREPFFFFYSLQISQEYKNTDDLDFDFELDY